MFFFFLFSFVLFLFSHSPCSFPISRSFHSNFPSLESLETFSIWFFTGNRKPQTAVCSLTLPGLQILVRRSLFSAAMLFFVQSKCSLLSPKRQGNSFIRVQNPTSTSQTDKESYFCLLHLPLDALSAVQT